MKLDVEKVFNLISGRSRRRRRGKERRWNHLRALIQTEQNKAEGIFDADWYRSAYPDVKSSEMTALQHYILHGGAEARNPGPRFDSEFYIDRYPDVRSSGTDPLVHYLEIGRAEGRAPNPGALPENQHLQVRHVIVKEMSLAPGEQAALLVTHTASGRLKPHILPYMKHLREADLAVLLVVIVDRPLELLDVEVAVADGVIVRENAGYDFGAWAHAFQLCPALFGAGLLVMTNDSVLPTSDKAVFGAMIDRVRQCPADIVGLTANHEYGWHIQSYFLAFKPKALASWGFQHFIRNIRRIDDKDEVIRTYEVPFAARMRAAGLTIQALFAGTFSANPTFFSWSELVTQGFPFIKLLILRKQFARDTDQLQILEDLQQTWPQVLNDAGFDVDLIRASVRAADLASLPAGSNTDLLIDAQKYEQISNDHPLRVAYFGPWNYESGLGAASREMLCALRRANIELNVYPVTKPFHFHRLICPSVETIDFGARPDIAIIHLNPDSWDMLTGEQLEIIQCAKRRIGYWVWETDRLPPTWQDKLGMVDRIWAPSAYCAEVFAAEARVPVDVVPHPVRVPSRIASDRDSVLRKLGIDPQRRVILYIFDGASYLVRKNPGGLIRAFAKSGLATQGWILVLKTKHLYDRPDAGRALSALVAETEGVQILESSLHADEVFSLLAAVDIYASPHCSEGFGLTVAEAMAAGKPVVATDYAGTRDFLDSSCGYPVAATLWTLEESHGHYLAGHTWAKVNEEALAATLVEVAARVNAGDTAIGTAAQARIADRLSYDAVAAAITASIDALMADGNDMASAASRRGLIVDLPAVPDYTVKLAAEQRFEKLTSAKGVVPVPLAHDLSWNGNPLPDGEENDWLCFAPHHAHIAPEAINIIVSTAVSRPDAVLFYGDDVAGGEAALDRIHLKPDYNRTLLVAQDYIGAPVIVRRKILADVGGLDPARGTAVLYDMVLRVAEAGGSIARIPHVLIGYDGRRPIADMPARRDALTACKFLADIELADGTLPGLFVQRKRFAAIGYPAISIVIPTRRARRPGADQTYIEGLLEGIARTAWPMDRITVIVGDDIAGEPKAWASDRWPFTLKRIETLRGSSQPFNYATKMNLLWRAASDDYIVMLNDDVVPTSPDWLAALLSFSSDESVGAVGGRLLYEDGSLQHAGIFPTMRTVAHAWLGWPEDAPTYQNWAAIQREWSMITGAVFATRRSLLDQLNGFDERFSLEFNDIDLCLRIRNLGYRIVYNPEACFTHVEKASRGDTVPPGAEVALFLSRWSRWLEKDPASHAGYAPDRFDIVPAVDPDAWYAK